MRLWPQTPFVLGRQLQISERESMQAPTFCENDDYILEAKPVLLMQLRFGELKLTWLVPAPL